MLILQKAFSAFCLARKHFALQARQLSIAISAKSATSTLLGQNTKMIKSIQPDVIRRCKSSLCRRRSWLSLLHIFQRWSSSFPIIQICRFAHFDKRICNFCSKVQKRDVLFQPFLDQVASIKQPAISQRQGNKVV